MVEVSFRDCSCAEASVADCCLRFFCRSCPRSDVCPPTDRPEVVGKTLARPCQSVLAPAFPAPLAARTVHFTKNKPINQQPTIDLRLPTPSPRSSQPISHQPSLSDYFAPPPPFPHPRHTPFGMTSPAHASGSVAPGEQREHVPSNPRRGERGQQRRRRVSKSSNNTESRSRISSCGCHGHRRRRCPGDRGGG